MANIDESRHLLVSDSNESGGHQWDSKRLSVPTLVDMMQRDLFMKHLNIFSRYLTLTQYRVGEDLVNGSLAIQQGLFDALKSAFPSGKFRVVEGQVVLVDMEAFAALKESGGFSGSPMEWVQSNWDVGLDYQLVQIQDCMLRGVVEVDGLQPMKRESNVTVALGKDNMPPHMHQSSLTRKSGLQGMSISGDKSADRDVSGLRYDLFFNDSPSTGLDNNEVQGTSENFKVSTEGSSEPRHPNLPPFRRYYAFAVRKIG